MRKTKIGKEEFMFKLNHSDEKFIHNLADTFIKNWNVAINKDQSKIDLINTLFAVYFKDKKKLPKNGFTKPNKIDTFSFKSHFYCPISEDSFLKKYYMLLTDTFGFNKKINRNDIVSVLEKNIQQTNAPYDAKQLIYRITDLIKSHHSNYEGKFMESLPGRKYVIFYNAVKKWDFFKPIF